MNPNPDSPDFDSDEPILDPFNLESRFSDSPPEQQFDDLLSPTDDDDFNTIQNPELNGLVGGGSGAGDIFVGEAIALGPDPEADRNPFDDLDVPPSGSSSADANPSGATPSPREPASERPPGTLQGEGDPQAPRVTNPDRVEDAPPGGGPAAPPSSPQTPEPPSNPPPPSTRGGGEGGYRAPRDAAGNPIA